MLEGLSSRFDSGIGQGKDYINHLKNKHKKQRSVAFSVDNENISND